MKYLLIFSISLMLFFSCTELGEPTIHPGGWTDSNSEDSHTAKIHESGKITCKTCHGDDYLGGTSEVSCYRCHAGGPSGHPAYDIWVESPDDPNFHGKDEIERCKTCHGDEYLGGTSGVSCYQCHDGPSGGHPAYDIWVESPDDPNFHGKDEIKRCKTCHGDDYLGGTSGVSCYQCHDGPSGYGCPDFDAPYTHSELLEDDDCNASHKPGYEHPIDNNCGNCHGTDLMGGWNGPSCYSCHGARWDDDDDD